MKRAKTIIGLLAILLGAALALFYLVPALVVRWLMREVPDQGAASVGIIGGADGPTAIFVTANQDSPALMIVGICAFAALVIAWAALHYITRKKNNPTQE